LDDSDKLGVVGGVTLNVGWKVEAIDLEDVLSIERSDQDK
jgi:hypothetical protein